MVKTKIITFRVTQEQYSILQAKARASGFMQISDYIRFTLFMPIPVEDKIEKIYKEVCKDG